MSWASQAAGSSLAGQAMGEGDNGAAAGIKYRPRPLATPMLHIYSLGERAQTCKFTTQRILMWLQPRESGAVPVSQVLV